MCILFGRAVLQRIWHTLLGVMCIYRPMPFPLDLVNCFELFGACCPWLSVAGGTLVGFIYLYQGDYYTDHLYQFVSCGVTLAKALG